jgi:predicted homoserine dehydrogenase-like protein
LELVRKLRQRQAEGKPISVGLIGCGQMGSGLAHTINNIDGMAVRAIADVDPNRGIQTYLEMGLARDAICSAETDAQIQDALATNRVVVTPHAELLTAVEAIEANVEATGVPDVGAAMALRSIENRKPIVMLNVETDITIGAYLSRLARRKGALYTVASGDEPGVCKMLFDQAVLMGFEVICLGKCKNNPIDLEMTPQRCEAEARSKDMNPKILASFIDGTKTMVEMAAVSNATGLLPDRPGMHGAKIEVESLVRAFVPREAGGIFRHRGTVEYSTGSFAPGVFAIVYTDDARIRKDMKFITKAEGPYYLHYRPYHLCDLETPQSIAEAVLLNEVTVAAETMHSEVAAVAKRHLKAGEKIAGIGSTDIYGRIYTYTEACEREAIPLGVAAGGTVTCDIAKGQVLSQANFKADESTLIYRLRRKQDEMLAREGASP